MGFSMFFGLNLFHANNGRYWHFSTKTICSTIAVRYAVPRQDFISMKSTRSQFLQYFVSYIDRWQCILNRNFSHHGAAQASKEFPISTGP